MVSFQVLVDYASVDLNDRREPSDAAAAPPVACHLCRVVWRVSIISCSSTLVYDK